MSSLEAGMQMNLLWGADAIARAVGLSRRQTFHLLETHVLPARKVGGRWVADLVVLRQYFQTTGLQP